MEAPKCKMCGTRHWPRQPCPGLPLPTPARSAPAKTSKSGGNKASSGLAAEAVVMSSRGKFDRVEYQREYMREYMRKRREK